MNYEEMSDFEINKAVVRALNTGKVFAMFTDSLLQCVYIDPMSGDKFDPCNNPNDMMPIVFANDMDIISPISNGTEYWEAHKFFADVKVYPLSFMDKNPLRAAAIVFLMMQDTKAK